MVHFKTIQTIQLILSTHIFVHLAAHPERAKPAERMGIKNKQDALRLADNPVVETADDGTDFCWFWVDAEELGNYRFGYNTSSLFPTNLKCIQKLNEVSNTWQDFWKES